MSESALSTVNPETHQEISNVHKLMHDAIRDICNAVLSHSIGKYNDLIQFEVNQTELLHLLNKIRDNLITDEFKNDSLTGLLLRHELEKNFNEMKAITKHTRNSTYLVLIDLDHFKLVNDSYGHLVGDMVLREVAEILKKTVRGKDQIYRYGGEEFLILLSAPADFNLEMCLNRILHNVSDFNVPLGDASNSTVNVTVTIGATQMLDDDKLNDSILRADSALYCGKQSGRNKYKIFK